MNEIFIYVSPWISVLQAMIYNAINVIHPALKAGLFDTDIMYTYVFDHFCWLYNTVFTHVDIIFSESEI